MACNDGDPPVLTIEECVAYYAYDMRQKDRVEQPEIVQIGRHCLPATSADPKLECERLVRRTAAFNVTSTLLAREIMMTGSPL